VSADPTPDITINLERARRIWRGWLEMGVINADLAGEMVTIDLEDILLDFQTSASVIAFALILLNRLTEELAGSTGRDVLDVINGI
jgi:hypothetical protein